MESFRLYSHWSLLLVGLLEFSLVRDIALLLLTDVQHDVPIFVLLCEVTVQIKVGRESLVPTWITSRWMPTYRKSYLCC